MKVCQALAQLGHQVTLLVPGDDSRKGSTPTDLNSLYGLQTLFNVEWLQARKIMRRYDFAISALRHARILRAEVLYVWLLQSAVAGLLLSLPVILEMHGPPEGRFGPLLFYLFLRLPGRKRLLVITQALGKILSQRYGESLVAPILLTAPNGVEIERYTSLPSPALARKLAGLKEGLTIACSGHLYTGRGMSLLVELARRFPKIQFLWLGGRPGDVQFWREHLAARAVSNVTLLGFIPNDRLPALQAAADILLMPYERAISGSSGGDSGAYASPMKMFEYMACQRVILSSDLPVIREVLNDSNSVLCPPGLPDDWARALERVLGDEGLRQRLVSQAWNDVQAYSWKKRAEKTLAGFLRE